MALFDIFKRQKTPEVSPISAVLPEQIYKQGVLELQDVIAPSALKITPREINLGDKIARTFFVMSYPRVLTESWFSPVINLDRVLDISIFIHPIDSAEILKTFQKKVAEVQSQISTREQKGLVRDPVLDTAYQDIEQLQQAQERIFDVGVYITIYGESVEELDKAESEIKSMLESRLVYVKPALFQQEQGFKSVLPLGHAELKVNSKLNSSPLSSIALTSDKVILYGVNRHNASLVLFDRFSLERPRARRCGG